MSSLPHFYYFKRFRGRKNITYISNVLMVTKQYYESTLQTLQIILMISKHNYTISQLLNELNMITKAYFIPTHPYKVESLISHGVRALGGFWIDLFGFDKPQPAWPRTALGLQKLSRLLHTVVCSGIDIATLGIHDTGLHRFHGNCIIVKVRFDYYL